MLIELELAALLALELWRERRARRSAAPPAPPAPLVVSLDPTALAAPFVSAVERLLAKAPELAPNAAASQNFTHEAPAPAVVAASVEIVKRAGESWVHVGHRHATHPDLAEALRTPGLALRHRSGELEEGNQ